MPDGVESLKMAKMMGTMKGAEDTSLSLQPALLKESTERLQKTKGNEVIIEN